MTAQSLQQLLQAGKFENVRAGSTLIRAGERPTWAYFPLSGLVGIRMPLSDGTSVDVADVSTEGMGGIAGALGGRDQLSTHVVDIGGTVVVILLYSLRQILDGDRLARGAVERYAALRLAQTELGVACIARHSVEARLARWLLRARSTGKSTELLETTQERLAQILGVHRPSVSLAASSLQSAGAIRYRRGRIMLVDSAQLEACACECYFIVNAVLADR